MNKIYKVVWSKAKHCYVVTSELAKRNTKGCGARSLRMAAVSMGVAAALMGGFSTTAEAKSVSKVIIDYSGYYVFQHSPKSLTVNQEAIDNVDSWTGNTYAYGNVRRGDSRAVTDVYYTIEDGESVRHSDINIYYGNPADPQSYFPVLTQNPFNDTTVIENNAIQYGTYSTIGEFAKADPDAKKEVTGYSLTLTGKGLTDVAGALSYGGSVSNNSLTVNGGAVTGDVYGGTTTSGDASYNAVTINSGTVSSNTYGKGNVYGGNSYYGNASYNAVTVNGGTVTGNAYSNGNVYGGNTSSGEATYNTVTITGGTISQVYGGNSNLNATNNTVTVQGGTVGSVTGAYSSKEANNNTVNVSKGTVGTSAGSYAVVGAANDGTSSGDPVSNGNHVTVTGTAQVTGLVIGARDAYFAAVITDNTVTLDGSAVVTGDVIGGYGRSKDKTKNKVYVNNGTVTGNVYGGELNSSNSGTGNATSNEVYISGGTVSGSVYGGDVKGKVSGNANSNRVEICGGTVKSSGAGSGDTVYGGYSETGNANSNKVQVSGESIIKLTVYGGVSKYEEGTANNNEVTVSDSANLPSGITAGWSPKKDAKNNTVTIEGGIVKGYIDGGVATGAADNNHIIVNGGTVSYLQGGSGGSSATGNTVEINGGTVTDTIYGGNSDSGSVSNNAVTITGGTMNGRWIYAGYTNSGTANNNIVNLTGTAALSNVSLYGTNKTGGTGNELHVGGIKDGANGVWYGMTSEGTVNNKVDYVGQFDKLVLHSVKWDTTIPALEATTVENVNTLDIKDINFDQIPSSGSMGLLKSGSDLSAIKLDHATGSGIAITTTGVDLAPVDMTETTGVNGVKLAQSVTGKVLLAADSKAINYSVAASEIKGVTFGEVTFAKNGIARDLSNRTFAATNTVDAADLTFVATDQVIAVNDSMKLVVNATNLTTTVANNTGKTVAVTGYEDAQKIKYNATASGTVTSDGSAVLYTVDSVTLSSVDLGNWSGTTSVVPESWSIADGATIKTDGMTAPTIDPGNHIDILQSNTDKYFAAATITGANVYKETSFKEEEKGIALAGVQSKGVTLNAEKNHLIYMVGKKNVNTVTLGSVNWQKDAVLLDGSSATEYDYAAITTIGTDAFDVTYAAPEKVAAGESMTLLKANETLTAIVNEEKSKAYSYTPASGVTVDAAITGKLTNSENNVVFTAAENKASKLTFGDVEWKDSGALLTRPGNITFTGADVDTSRINFTNMIYLDADRQMTLVSDFGDKVGTITGSKYLVGTAFEGEGAASLSGKDLIFRTKTGAGVSEQTHKTVMATEAGVTALNVGSDYIGKALDGMGDVANVAPDGSTVGAAIGGGKNRYETGSHVNVNSWNAAVAVGAKREVKGGSLEYGVFGEYGKANYTLHSDAGKGDGDSHYAGGGLLAKWTNKHDVYTEASFRLGRLNESSSDIMRDGLGNAYGYDVHANYYGAHVGVGKIFRYNGGRSLDVYGKYFYTKRNGVEFDAVQHYNLDSVSSSVLRIGARYGTTDKKWNWYGGLAYEYEFDGEAEGVVNGVAIRAASIKGSSVRGEIGLRMNATKTNPWQTDISIYGYGGKHRGFGGNVNVAYMF
ncbi:MAG: hypothetical protein IJ522_05780 [Acidaminococcaceae bacterium]|nr:hypothetical protein [Acidaminococcaceae bacterium]